MVKPVHTAVKGRARFKVEGLYGSPALESQLVSSLSRNAAVTGVSSSTLTGNILVRFNSGNGFHAIAALIESILQEYRAEGSRGASGPIEGFGRRTSAPVEREATGAGALRVVPGWEALSVSSTGEAQFGEPWWHSMSAEAALTAWKSDPSCGLTTIEAMDRFKLYGGNVIPEPAARSRFRIFVDQFQSLPVVLLGVAAGISVITGGLADAVVIAGVMAINGLIGYATESEAERTISSLKDFVRPSADVLRDGAVTTVTADEVVPGDILVLRPGTYVAADARIIEASHLSLDESVLTGESMPVAKTPDSLFRPDIAIADRANMVYMGTLVMGGQGLAVVVATGRATEAGRLQVLIGEATSPKTPMERQLSRLGDRLVLLSGAACGLVLVIGLLRGYRLLEMLKTSISLAVASVPEGLPAVATTTLALGIRNMRRHRLLIRRLEAVEALGCMQTICLDKTGTITENRMAVVRIFTGMRDYRSDNGRFMTDATRIDPRNCEELMKLIEISVLCNETELEGEPGMYNLRGSPTESALVELALQSEMDVTGLRRRYRLLKVDHRSESRLFMDTLHEFEQEGRRRVLIAMKGSPMEVLSLCKWHLVGGERIALSEDDRSLIELENERMANDALRVLGLACTVVEEEEEAAEAVEANEFVWLGLIGMADPVRPGVKELIRKFHSAGIDTIMITGDQSPTAYSIGKELDLSRGAQLEILDSTHLANMDPETLKALSGRVHVFARVSPANKLEIVQALQSRGRVIAMTGDGINDGPALKAADIGIAMGSGGTDIARDIADVVLEENDLDVVIVAVRDGRTIFRNIRKSLHFLLATNFSEIIVTFLSVSAGFSSPLSAIQLLWINLMSDIFPGLALALEPPEPDVLDVPPRPPDEAMVKGSDFKRMGFEATVLSLSAMAAYGYGIGRYGMGPRAGTMAFQSLTSGQLLHAISCRSEEHSILDPGKLPPNPYLTLALGGSFAIQALTVFLPGLRGLLGLAPVGLLDGAVIAGAAALPLLVNESTKEAKRSTR